MILDVPVQPQLGKQNLKNNDRERNIFSELKILLKVQNQITGVKVLLFSPRFQECGT